MHHNAPYATNGKLPKFQLGDYVYCSLLKSYSTVYGVKSLRSNGSLIYLYLLSDSNDQTWYTEPSLSKYFPCLRDKAGYIVRLGDIVTDLATQSQMVVFKINTKISRCFLKQTIESKFGYWCPVDSILVVGD